MSEPALLDLMMQMRIASRNGLFFTALYVALALPDMCGALEAENGRATGARYASWFDAQMGGKYAGWLSGKDCYLFRCALLHQGRARLEASNYTRILFREPGPMTMHRLVMDMGPGDRVLMIDVREFCDEIAAAVQAWLPTALQKPHVQKNLEQVVARYPNGLPPYVVGAAIIG